MVVDIESRLLQEPANIPGVTRTGKPSWFEAPADEGPMGYWRKPTDGHIILAFYGENGTEKKLDRGFVRLGAKYGTYSSSAIADAKDPLYPLVARGGLGEFPAEQIKLLGWHRKPDRNAKRSHQTVEALVEQTATSRGITRDEALVVVMPQLRGYDLTDYLCVACPGRWFPHEAAQIAHTSVMHKEAIQSESIGKAVAAAQGAGTGAGDASALLTLIAQQGETIAAMKAQIDALNHPPAPAAVATPKGTSAAK